MQGPLTGFIHKAKAMREAQKAYFKDRTQINLIAARRLEAELDALIETLLHPSLIPDT